MPVGLTRHLPKKHACMHTHTFLQGWEIQFLLNYMHILHHINERLWWLYFTRGGRRSKSPENVPFSMQIVFNNNITRCFMKYEAKWTTPVIWAEFLFKFWYWMFMYWATTLYPGPLFTSKHYMNTSFMMRNRLTCWKPDLVELGFPHFLAPLLLII